MNRAVITIDRAESRFAGWPRFTLFILAGSLLGCGGGQSSLKPLDLSLLPADLAQAGTNVDMAGSGSGADMATSSAGCLGSYTKATVATMRQGSSNCYELDNVVTIAVTPVGTTTKSVTLYVQDAMGGDYSAIKLDCSSTSTSHPCSVFSTAKNILAGRAVTTQGTYIKSSAAKGGFEEFYVDTISDNAAGSAPTPASLVETDVERSTTMSSGAKAMVAYHYQLITANISDKLLMFDWSPPEFAATSGSCPQFGFGMIPTSAGGTAGASCSGSTQPPGQSTVNPKEVLVGTSFYGGFTDTTDCSCGTMYMQPVPTTGQGVSGTITALLDYDVPFGQTTGYQYLQPLTNAAFDIH